MSSEERYSRYSVLVTRYSLLVTRYSLLVTHYSLLITITSYSLLITHYSLLVTHQFARGAISGLDRAGYRSGLIITRCFSGEEERLVDRFREGSMGVVAADERVGVRAAAPGIRLPVVRVRGDEGFVE